MSRPLAPEPHGVGEHLEWKRLGQIAHHLDLTLLEKLDRPEGVAFALKSSRNRRIAVGDMTLCSTLRVRSCSGGSVSSTMLFGRHGTSLAKSCRPTPRADE